MTEQARADLLSLTVVIVSSHVANNSVATADLPDLIERVYSSLSRLGASSVSTEHKQEPAVPIRSSIKRDHLVCLECGAKMKMLKRHLTTDHDMTPDAYRAKWALPKSYPMIAADYAEQRRSLAVSIGLGRKRYPEAASGPIETQVPEPLEPAQLKRTRHPAGAGETPQMPAGRRKPGIARPKE